MSDYVAYAVILIAASSPGWYSAYRAYRKQVFVESKVRLADLTIEMKKEIDSSEDVDSFSKVLYSLMVWFQCLTWNEVCVSKKDSRQSSKMTDEDRQILNGFFKKLREHMFGSSAYSARLRKAFIQIMVIHIVRNPWKTIPPLLTGFFIGIFHGVAYAKQALLSKVAFFALVKAIPERFYAHRPI